MDKKSIIGLILIFVVMMGFAYFNSPSMKADEQTQTVAQTKTQQKPIDSTLAANATSPSVKDSSTQLPLSNSDSLNPKDDASHPFFLSLQGELKEYSIENEVFKLDFQNKGGRISSVFIKEYLTWKKDSLYLFDAQNSDFFLSFFSHNRLVSTDQLYFSCSMPSQTQVSGTDSLQVMMRLYAQKTQAGKTVLDSSRYIEWIYTVYGNQYRIGIDLHIVQMQEEIAANTNFIDLTWQQHLKQFEKAQNMEQMNTTIFYKPLNDKADNLKETKDDSKELTTPTRWISFKQQFFSVSLISDKNFGSASIHQIADKDPQSGYLKDMRAIIGMPYENKADQNIHLSLYAGPNKYRILRDYNLDLERQIPLGWGFFLMQWINRGAVIPVFDFLQAKGLNYGLIILVLTILLKLVLSPVTYKSYLSSAKMRVIQPEVEIINKKFPKQDQAMEKQKAVMALYKKAGVSPMSGCIPMLLQFPILIAMFRFFPASIELRQQPFLWADDLSSYDSVLQLPFTIPFYGNHVSLFALLMAITNVLYTRMTMKQTASTNQMPGMKMMMYAMPILFLGMLNSYSSALNYYYFLSMLFTFGQMWLIRQFVNDEKVMTLIQENKKKPVKRSKFQERLEMMSKKQQEILRQQQQQKRK